MSLPIPNLDDRRFQDIVDEAKRLIPRYCPEWTDHNVSDPGVTLIELFAWMTEMLIYRLNRVPEKNYLTFMELMGVQLQAPAAARTALTFWLATPVSEVVTIPAGVEVATVQTATQGAVTFSTDADLVVRPPLGLVCLASPDDQQFQDHTWVLEVDKQFFPAFSAKPQPGDAFYLGYDTDVSNDILSLLINCKIEGIGVDPKNPPLAWESWCEDGWYAAELEADGDETGGLNRRGRVVMHLPPGMTQRELGGQTKYWVRCRYTQPQPKQPGYSATPQIHDIESATLGGTVSAMQATTVVGELLGRSDGMPGQTLRLEYPPILPRRPGETIEIQAENGTWETWTECEHFGGSRPGDMHFTLDSVNGQICFGPAIREPDGSERQYGAIPQRGAQIRFTRYRSGGGAAGNVGKDTLTVLKSSIPYVDRVTNRRTASGGRDAESLERAKLRAPQMLRTRFRAVTEEDYEYLAREASPGIARAHCLQPRAVGASGTPPPGVVQLLLVPMLDHPEGYIARDQLRLPPSLVQDVQRYLDERRLLTAIVRISEPAYQEVAVEARIKARTNADPVGVRNEATARLYRFLNPLVGGTEGEGWPFGRDLYISEIYAILQSVPGVEYIEQVNLLADGTRGTQAHVRLAPNGLITSREHHVAVV